jgi:hypothetical protein
MVAANNGPSMRNAVLQIAGQTVMVSQAGAGTCTYAVTPTSVSLTAAGGSGALAVAAPTACGWAAASQAAWITITSGGSGSGNGAIGYVVAPNASTSRTGTIAAAGQTITITQLGTAGQTCTYATAPPSAGYTAPGGAGTVTVTTQAGCAWTATRSGTWITMTAGSSGSGSGAVHYTVAANTGSNGRTGSITAAGQTIPIAQAGTSGACTYNVSPTSANFSAAGSNNSEIDVNTAGSCAWTATSQAAWITITDGSSDTGNGHVKYRVAINTTLAARVGTMTVAGRTVTISQSAVAPETTLMANSGDYLVRGQVNTGWRRAAVGAVLGPW